MAYTPPLIAIFLLLIAEVSNGYAKSRVHDFVSGHSELKGHESVIAFLVLDWAARLSFFNSMFAALFSVAVVWSTKNGAIWAGVILAVLAAVFVIMFWWIMAHGPDALPSTLSRFGKLKHTTICRLVLLIVNMLLLVAIWISRNT